MLKAAVIVIPVLERDVLKGRCPAIRHRNRIRHVDYSIYAVPRFDRNVLALIGQLIECISAICVAHSNFDSLAVLNRLNGRFQRCVALFANIGNITGGACYFTGFRIVGTIFRDIGTYINNNIICALECTTGNCNC